MTLDPKSHEVYFVIYNPISENRYSLLRTSIERTEAPTETVAVLPSQKIDGPLAFRSGKLFYVEDLAYVVTHDLVGQGR